MQPASMPPALPLSDGVSDLVNRRRSCGTYFVSGSCTAAATAESKIEIKIDIKSDIKSEIAGVWVARDHLCARGDLHTESPTGLTLFRPQRRDHTQATRPGTGCTARLNATVHTQR